MYSSLISPYDFQPSLPLPRGFSKPTILEALASVSLDGGSSGELLGYATADCERFLRTLSLIPEDAHGKLIEIGANPYLITLLVKSFRPNLDLTLLNYFGEGFTRGKQEVEFPGFSGTREHFQFDYDNVNIETATLPYPNGAFDYVLFCEVLEHLTNDPMHALLELKRILKPGGVMILTTPNAARIENIVALISGRNVYDYYSKYGPYGRHNREYTRHELHTLLVHCGFEAETSYTANVHAEPPADISNTRCLNKIIKEIKNREYDLGQYFFTAWRNNGPANTKFPPWLYRSYPADQMDNG